MNAITLLQEQTRNTYGWVDKLVAPIPHDQWETCPEGIESSISWQVGHLTLSLYYHTVMVLHGRDPEIGKTLKLGEYTPWFNQGAPQDAAGKIVPAKLWDRWQAMQEYSLSGIGRLAPEELEGPQVDVGFPHPVAQTKRGAIEWNIQHTAWHAGQISMIRRAVFGRYEFREKA
ncbi:DinB family protein [Pontibacter sp. G13]|uniref:DinB family protein n=1 Tax=Pontibacter sp. G13 TaxID=3074898 RepID=UPI00288AB9BD|nr:DinB family protein [Pontibacter sp. G13]WNJ20019.1 DinB family protein [Pontibacter sp. G13]